jgi:hypothetical protein
MKRVSAFGLAAIAVLATGLATAQDDGDEAAGAVDDIADEYLDRTPVECVSLSMVRDTAVIDDGTVLFYMRGGDVYRNVLERACFGLELTGRFITETRTNRLCSIDMLQVFRQFAGSVVPGAFCRLGKFHPLTRAEAELLEMDLDELEAARRSVKLTPLEPTDRLEPVDPLDSVEARGGAPEPSDPELAPAAVGDDGTASEQTGP